MTSAFGVILPRPEGWVTGSETIPDADPGCDSWCAPWRGNFPLSGAGKKGGGTDTRALPSLRVFADELDNSDGTSDI